MNDLRYAARTLRNSPGFTAIVTILLALGIAANCVIFSAVDAVMLKRLPVREPQRLFRVVTNLPQLGKRSYMSRELMEALRDRAKLVSEVFGEQEEFSVIREPGPSEQIRLRSVMPNFFGALGVNALYGRLIGPGDTDAAVLSYGFFERRFGGKPETIGRSIVLEKGRYTIVGVLPKNFNGIAIDTGPEVRVLLDPAAKEVFLELSVRLRDGATPAQASAEINAIRNAIDPKEDIEMFRRVELEPLEHGISRLRDRFSSALLFLTGAAGVLLLMVCVNVAGLLIARSAGRSHEMAVRLALGATRARLIRQMLTENLLLSLIGGLGSIALAVAAAPLVERVIPPQRDYSNQITPMTLDLHLDWRVFAFSLALCAVAAIFLGLIPAWSAARTALDQALRSARTSRRWRGRQALMVFEIALCTALLAGAGLLVRTFEQLHHLDPGFDRDHVVTFTVDPMLNNYKSEQIAPIARAWRDRILGMPGVAAVGRAQMGLMRGSGMKTTAGVNAQRLTPADFMNTSMNGVSLEYFDAMGMRVVTGRNFVAADGDRIPRPVIVNQTFARRFFPGTDPIGKLVGGGSPGTVVKGNAEIVGVVSDAKYRSLREPIQPTEYSLRSEEFASGFTLYVRTANRPESIIAPAREALRSIDPALPIVETHTLAEEVDASLWSERLTASLVTIFAAMAAILTAVGLYGLLAYSVAQRRREIGIRMALGAAAGDIGRDVGQPAILMAAIGVAIGVSVVLLVAPAIRALLYGIAATDTLTLLTTASFVFLVAALSAAVPILRALRIDPARALRQD
jgi:predicted permease